MPSPEMAAEGHFCFDPQDPIYADHFPGRPVVPGSLILEAFLTAARPVMKGPGGCTLENFRFRRFLTPGRYAFRLECQSDGSLLCTLRDQGRVVVTGTLRESGQGRWMSSHAS
jgi:3-hydroxyacyl-[acyl-carrier-protein] dehydratase